MTSRSPLASIPLWVTTIATSSLAWLAVDRFYGWSSVQLDFTLFEYIFLLWLPPILVACVYASVYHGRRPPTASPKLGYAVGVGLTSVLVGGLVNLFLGKWIEQDPQGMSTGIRLAIYGESAAILGILIICANYWFERRSSGRPR